MPGRANGSRGSRQQIPASIACSSVFVVENARRLEPKCHGGKAWRRRHRTQSGATGIRTLIRTGKAEIWIGQMKRNQMRSDAFLRTDTVLSTPGNLLSGE